MSRIITLTLATALVLAACGTDDAVTEPRRTEPSTAHVTDVDFVFLESDPVQVVVTIRGDLPTPCHDLVVTRVGDRRIEVSSLHDPEETCIQVVEPFETSVSLGDHPGGSDRIIVNGESYPFQVGTPAPDTFVKAPAFVEAVQFIFLESYPVQVRAIISGNLPTPCHTTDAVVTGRDGGRVTIEVTSFVPADAICAQVLQAFEVDVAVGDFESGDYAAVINGVEYPFTI